ncbi:MAG: hypothetical protein JO362_14330 [Streptomycetaceae bacterium]|nr:hypothetical protein [Streptomycetaceae bacterium]
MPVDERPVPHLVHLRLSQQIKGSPRREGLRLLLLAIADFVVFMGLPILGDQVVPHPAGIEAVSARLGFVLAGFAAAGALTVALRRTVAPARLPRVPEA